MIRATSRLNHYTRTSQFTPRGCCLLVMGCATACPRRDTVTTRLHGGARPSPRPGPMVSRRTWREPKGPLLRGIPGRWHSLSGSALALGSHCPSGTALPPGQCGHWQQPPGGGGRLSSPAWPFNRGVWVRSCRSIYSSLIRARSHCSRLGTSGVPAEHVFVYVTLP